VIIFIDIYLLKLQTDIASSVKSLFVFVYKAMVGSGILEGVH